MGDYPHIVNGECPVCDKAKARDEAQAAATREVKGDGHWVTLGGGIETTRETGSEPVLADQPPDRELGT